MVTIPYRGNEEVAIHIYDQNDQLIYTDKTNLEGDFAPVYNLKNLEGGATFQLVNQSTGEEKFFNVN